MQVYDPYGYRMVAVEECEVAPVFRGYHPVRPHGTARWFAVYMPTGQSLPLEEVSGLPDHVRSSELTFDLSYAIESARAFRALTESPGSMVDMQQAREAAIEQHGPLAVQITEAELASQGYAEGEVREAWLGSDTVSPLEEILSKGKWDRVGQTQSDAESWSQRFRVNGKTYTFSAQLDEQGSWELGFLLERYDPDSGPAGGTTDITGTGDQFAVFSAVSVLLGEFLQEKDPATFWFAAKEPSRQRLYAKMVSRIESLGYRRTQSAVRYGSKDHPVPFHLTPGKFEFARVDESMAVREDIPAWVNQINEGVDDKAILKAIFILGSGGAGKGTVARVMFGGDMLKNINADTHLERMMTAKNIPFKDVGMQYGLIKKAQKLRDIERTHYGRRRLGMIIDITGWDYDRVANPVKELRALGYDCYCIFVNTSLDTTLRRNAQRAAGGGRLVPDFYIQDAWTKSQKNMDGYRKLFTPGKFFLIDNDKDATPEEWENEVKPRLRKVARAILKAPLHNPKGKAWLAAGGKDLPATAKSTSPSLPAAIPANDPTIPKLARGFAPKPKLGVKAVPTIAGQMAMNRPAGPLEPRPLPPTSGGRKINMNPWAPRPFRPARMEAKLFSNSTGHSRRRRPGLELFVLGESVDEVKREETDLGTVYYVDPTPQEVIGLAKKSKQHHLRGLAGDDGRHVYWWDAGEQTHEGMATELGIDWRNVREDVWEFRKLHAYVKEGRVVFSPTGKRHQSLQKYLVTTEVVDERREELPGDELVYLVDPSEQELRGMIRRSEHDKVRGLVDGKHAYFWDAFSMTHDEFGWKVFDKQTYYQHALQLNKWPGRKDPLVVVSDDFDWKRYPKIAWLKPLTEAVDDSDVLFNPTRKEIIASVNRTGMQRFIAVGTDVLMADGVNHTHSSLSGLLHKHQMSGGQYDGVVDTAPEYMSDHEGEIVVMCRSDRDGQVLARNPVVKAWRLPIEPWDWEDEMYGAPEDDEYALEFVDEGDADEPANTGAARALVGFIRSQMKDQYIAQVVRPVALYKAKGTYKRDEAPKLARHLVVAAGQKKGGDNGEPWHSKYGPKTRLAAEVLVRNAAEKDAAAGMATQVLPKKYRPGFSGYNENAPATLQASGSRSNFRESDNELPYDSVDYGASGTRV